MVLFLLYMLLCVTCACVQMQGCPCSCMWRADISIGCLPLSLPTLGFEIGSHRTWPTTRKDPPAPVLARAEVIGTHGYTQLFHRCWDPTPVLMLVQHLLWKTPLHCVRIWHCDWFTKETDWPIAEQNKVRQESQTENAWRAESGVASRCREKQDGHAIKWNGTKPCGKA